MPDKISQELLEAAQKAEAVEAHRTWAQLLAERVAATTASKRLKPGDAAEIDAVTAQALLNAALPPPPPLQTHPGTTSSGGFALPLPLDLAALGLQVPPQPPLVTSAPAFSAEHPSAPPSDSEDDHMPGGGGGGGSAPSRRGRVGSGVGTRSRGASRDPLTRAEATKEKNRRAQQRFRHKQKSRMEALEAEVVRLRAMLAERGGDPGEALPDPDAAFQAQYAQQQQQAQMQAAAEQQQQQQPPSLDAMYSDLEAWLEAAEGVPRHAAVRFLQGWTEMPDDARRLHYRSLQKRRAAGDTAGVALWVNTQVESRMGGGMSPAEGLSPRGGGSGGGSGGAGSEHAAPSQQRIGAASLTAALPQVASR